MKVATTSEQGFEAVYRARATPLLRLALLLCGDRDQAEDAVAEAVSRSWRRWETGTIDDLNAYLRRAVVNAVTDTFRRQGRSRDRARRRSGDDRPGSDQTDVAHQVVVRSTVLDALDQLPDAQRSVLVLRYYEDQTEAATADLLGIAVGTVKSRASRGLATLAHTLGPPEESP